jgi:hypothetical protein
LGFKYRLLFALDKEVEPRGPVRIASEKQYQPGIAPALGVRVSPMSFVVRRPSL